MIRYTLIALALITIPVAAEVPLNDKIGRFQVTATNLPDGSPGLWVLDTVFGRVAMCSYQKALEQGGTTSSGVEWSISEVTCSAFIVPKKGPWDKYQKE